MLSGSKNTGPTGKGRMAKDIVNTATKRTSSGLGTNIPRRKTNTNSQMKSGFMGSGTPGDRIPIRGPRLNNLGPEAFEDEGSSNQMQCKSCRRTFNEKPYSIHIKICKKIFVNKRKEYNA